MYYTGYDFRHGGFDLKTTRRAGVVSRVVQRLDGFVSADAAYDGGELTTVPLVFKGRELRLNTDTGALGALRVELLDEQGRALEGFRESECDAINGNFIDRRVTWRGSGNVGGLEGRVVRIRFVMRSAKLFAFRFAEAG
jgi:hypothetical protein